MEVNNSVRAGLIEWLMGIHNVLLAAVDGFYSVKMKH